MLGPILLQHDEQLRFLRRAQESDPLVVFGLGLDRRSGIDSEDVIFDGLAKDERERVPITVTRRRRPLAFFTLLKQPCLDVLARDPFRAEAR